MRQRSNHNQARLPATAKTRATAEYGASNPGASLAILAAGLAGVPVCIATYKTQIVIAQPLKKNIDNQSIAADALRLSVGSANAASTARPGSPSISARSDPRIARLAPSATSTATSGTDRCRLRSCRRQRHSVHKASGHAGHMNHNH